MRLVGVDVGGTFTDCVFVDTEAGLAAIHKLPTTPDDPSRGVVEGVTELCARHGIAHDRIDQILHGTTTATNAVLEFDGAKAGMITNEGFRDVIHIGRHQRPQHYSIMQDIPWQDRPLIRRRHRRTVRGRLIPPSGEELEPLDEKGVRQAALAFREEGIDSIAICFLFSYLNPVHEDRAREIVLAEHPRSFISTSSSVSGQFREFERFTTAAMNAFIGPRMRRYVERLETLLRAQGYGAQLRIMASNGGVATAAMVLERPVLTLLSGPAAGVLGGIFAGKASGRDSLITFDVGGTSADIGIVRQGEIAEATARDTGIGGYPLLVPMLDIHTIGAGGGSIAHVDAGGAFRVGPRSAGARPGPAGYGRGGIEPTVTDANIVLGRLDAENFLGGAMSLNLEAATQAIARLASRLGLGLVETAHGVLTLVNANMTNLIRSRTLQKGIDPREFALVAFGGAGPLQASDVAAELGVREVIIPAAPGITSAVGLVASDLKADDIRTTFADENADPAEIEAMFLTLEHGLVRRFAGIAGSGSALRIERSADLRYRGQGYELSVPVGRPIDAASFTAIFLSFTAKHLAEYGAVHTGNPVEIVNLRALASYPMPDFRWPTAPAGGSLGDGLVKRKSCSFRMESGFAYLETPVYRRDLLPRGAVIAGPALIVQTDATSLLHPGDQAVVDAGGNLLVSVGQRATHAGA